MRKTYVFFLLVAMLLLSGCSGKNAVNEPIELPETAYIDRLFAVDGQLYSVRHGSGAAYINHESAEPSVCYQIPSDDAVWHESCARLYYSDGYQVYSCDLTGNEKTLVWTFQNKSKEDRADIMAAADGRLLVSGAYWWGGQYPTSDYYSLDVTTGEAVKLMGNVAVAFQPELLCIYGNTAFFVQKDGQNYYVLACDLLSGESKELGRFDYEAAIRIADGAVLGDRLYFICERNGIYSVPLSGGEVEYRWPDTDLTPGMDRVVALDAYNGELYVLLKDGADYPPAAFCRWEAETNLLHPILTTDGTFSAGNAFLHDGKYYLFTGSKLVSGELRVAEGGQNIDIDSQMDGAVILQPAT